MAAKIKKGDKVRVLTGKYRGVEGEVLKVMPAESRVIVRGVNIIKKHQKQTMQEQGGILTREAPIHVSNVALLAADGAPTRVGFRIEGDGRKVRIAKRTGEVVNG
ncbi:MAG: 50S ribosomal protein L24 [Parvularculaceae bacterium]|nr:50S ribosomal protein L24 [Parvularculaceae bacterium]